VSASTKGTERDVMTGTRLLERLTASDLFLLIWDDYGWSSDIGALAVLDSTGLLDRDGRVRIEAVRRQLEPRLHLVPASGSVRPGRARRPRRPRAIGACA
jgi:hypothetical protein